MLPKSNKIRKRQAMPSERKKELNARLNLLKKKKQFGAKRLNPVAISKLAL